jgi:predicted lipoprotein with Yx(FWY)xxD motif
MIVLILGGARNLAAHLEDKECSPMKRVIPIVFLAALAGIVFAITSSGSSNAHKASPTTTQPSTSAYGGAYGGGTAAAPPAANSAVGVRGTSLGKVLVDAGGRTLYLFERDQPDMSSCTGACQSIWPSFTAQSNPKAMGGVSAARLSTIAATGGKRQVTYNGHPLYYYVGDRKPGDTTGQGLNQFGAEWYVLAANGSKIDHG